MAWSPDPTDALTWRGAQLNDTGFGPGNPHGTLIELVEGLLDHPEFRVANRARPGRHGARAGALRLSARGLTLSGIIFGQGRDDLEARKDDLAGLLVPDGEEGVLAFTVPGVGDQLITARVEQPLTWGDPFELGSTGPRVGIRFLIGMVAHDPRRYGAELVSAQTSDVATSGGFTLPMTFPLTFLGAGAGGTVTVPAGGNFERPATLLVYGPVSNPIVEAEGASSDLAIAFDGLTVNEGDVLTIDTDEQTATVSTATAADYSRLVRALDPLLYLPLGEDPGATTALDGSGFARNFTYTNSPSVGEAGVLALDDNGATNFDGVNDYATRAFDAALNPATTWSLEAWVNPDTVAGTDTVLDAITANRGFGIDLVAGVPQVRVGTGGTVTTLASTLGALGTALWHHLVATYDGATLRFYVNGSLAASVAATYAANTAGATRIGSTVAGANFFDGKIDEVTIYGVTLTTNQVAQHAQLPSIATSTELNAYPYLDFDATQFENLPPDAVTLRLRGSTITDPAALVVETRAAYI